MRSTSTSSTRTFITPTATPEQPEVKRRSRKFRLPRLGASTAVIALLVLVSLFLFAQYEQARHKLQSQTASTTSQDQSIIAKVSKLAVVPKNVTPTVATVNDAAKLKSQSFFANAQNGDKVLVYTQQKEAILYRPSTNQIVTVSPVSLSGSNISD